ncbi:patatin-like phospholipase family protein [Segetibacter sp. 3557_3]|uniref:patatin-like phospholipase family protein n=1 Tax=Segetibacter sp. 3557_3 TaxID=2547429 RepID=UPI001058F400|nr:patatin-like phospholipase family protein [Segetibacter sp. 3557_3]TDH28980.1 patatin-like phospholipase family protein [Segetibacter sp. 3557_3]
MSRALVISGGGSKGAYAVGVVQQLAAMYPKLDFDIYVGTSAGALVITLASLKEFALLEQLYTSVKTSDILRKFNVVDRINEHSLFDANGAWNKIITWYPDTKFAALQRSGKKMFLTTTCLQTGRLTVFANNAKSIKPEGYQVNQLINADHYRRALMASICEPVFMPPVKVNLHVPGTPNPNYQYVDGGVTKYAGVQMAIDAGATEIFVILLSAESTTVNTEFTTLFPILQQTIDILTTDVGKNDLLLPEQYNQALSYIDAVKRKMLASGLSQTQVDSYFRLGQGSNLFEGKSPLKIFKIRPTTPLGGGPGGLTFDPAEMKQMLARGKTAVGEFIASLDPKDITWA